MASCFALVYVGVHAGRAACSLQTKAAGACQSGHRHVRGFHGSGRLHAWLPLVGARQLRCSKNRHCAAHGFAAHGTYLALLHLQLKKAQFFQDRSGRRLGCCGKRTSAGPRFAIKSGFAGMGSSAFAASQLPLLEDLPKHSRTAGKSKNRQSAFCKNYTRAPCL